MDVEKWSFRIGAAALALAVLLRLYSNGFFGAVVNALTAPETIAAIFVMETGKMMYAASKEPTIKFEPTLPPAEESVPTPEKPVLRSEDAPLVQVNSLCGYEADVPAWLEMPLSWELEGQKPTVLILHSHGSESYENTENYKPSGDYRTQDNRYNMVSVGEELKRVLEAGGVQVIHDTTLYDCPSYNASYDNARKGIKEALNQYPEVSLVLDLHRDAVADSNGNQKKYTVKNGEEIAAQLMMVVGTDARLSHPQWPENMSLAVKLHALLEKRCPGICRPISFRSQRFNQDLSSGAMLIEVGSAGNTRQEALAAARILGETILEISHGTA